MAITGGCQCGSVRLRTFLPALHNPCVLFFAVPAACALQCWAFSTVEEIESGWLMAGNAMVELSPQQIVDCDTVD